MVEHTQRAPRVGDRASLLWRNGVYVVLKVYERPKTALIRDLRANGRTADGVPWSMLSLLDQEDRCMSVVKFDRPASTKVNIHVEDEVPENQLLRLIDEPMSFELVPRQVKRRLSNAKLQTDDATGARRAVKSASVNF